jgi:hypothetical protein
MEINSFLFSCGFCIGEGLEYRRPFRDLRAVPQARKVENTKEKVQAMLSVRKIQGNAFMLKAFIHSL